MTETDNLRQLRDLIKELIQNNDANENDFICINMKDFAQSRRQGEFDWVLTVHIKTESGLNSFKEALKEAIIYHNKQNKRNTDIEKILNEIYCGLLRVFYHCLVSWWQLRPYLDYIIKILIFRALRRKKRKISC